MQYQRNHNQHPGCVCAYMTELLLVSTPDANDWPSLSVTVIYAEGNSCSRPTKIGSQRSRLRIAEVKVETDANVDVINHWWKGSAPSLQNHQLSVNHTHNHKKQRRNACVLACESAVKPHLEAASPSSLTGRRPATDPDRAPLPVFSFISN